jgi:hypothetical protein
MMKHQNATNKMTQFVTVKSLIWQFVTDAGTDLTLRSKLKVIGHQQWDATHRLEMVYLHAKYEKSVLNDKKVTARTRFIMDARTSLTLRSKDTNNGTQHIIWKWSTYMANMENLSWTTKKLQPGHDLLRTDGQIDHYRASVTKWRGPN